MTRPEAVGVLLGMVAALRDRLLFVEHPAALERRRLEALEAIGTLLASRPKEGL